MREEYQDQVQSLQGLLGNTEQRIRQMECDSEEVQSIANHLSAEGRDMQRNTEASIMRFRQRSQIASSSNVDLQLASQSTALELREPRDETYELQQSLGLAQRSIQFTDDNVKKVVRECRLKVSEANQLRLESDHKLRVLLNEAELRQERSRENETQAIADHMTNSQEIEELKGQISRLEAMLKVEATASNNEIAVATRGNVKNPMIEVLEGQFKIREVQIGDLMDEATQNAMENLRLRDEVQELSLENASSASESMVEKYKSELRAEKKPNLVALNDKGKTIWQMRKDQIELRNGILEKDEEISTFKMKVGSLVKELEQVTREHPNDYLSFSAGIYDDENHDMQVAKLRSELEVERGRHSVTKSYQRQVDDAYNREAEEVAQLIRRSESHAESNAATSGVAGQASSQQAPTTSIGSAATGVSAPTMANLRMGGASNHTPSLRGSIPDDTASQSNLSGIEASRVSRREADKVVVLAMADSSGCGQLEIRCDQERHTCGQRW